MNKSKTIEELVKSLPPYAKLSGSRALSTENEQSDWDFYVPEKNWDNFRQWCLDNLGMFESNITGHIFYYIGKRTHNNLIEFSHMFPNYKLNTPQEQEQRNYEKRIRNAEKSRQFEKLKAEGWKS